VTITPAPQPGNWIDKIKEYLKKVFIYYVYELKMSFYVVFIKKLH